MPVEDIPVHPMTVQTARYDACRESVRKPGYWVEVRKYETDGFYTMAMDYIEDRHSKDCRYDLSQTDPRCEGCKRRGSGEAYYKRVTGDSGPRPPTKGVLHMNDIKGLTHPVLMKPVAKVNAHNVNQIDWLDMFSAIGCGDELYSESQLRQVMAERDDLEQELKHFRDNARPAFIRQTNDQNKITALERLQPQVAMLREALEDCRGNINPERGYADELEADIRKALAATEPKGE